MEYDSYFETKAISISLAAVKDYRNCHSHPPQRLKAILGYSLGVWGIISDAQENND
jgi:hypothetical protein